MKVAELCGRRAGRDGKPELVRAAGETQALAFSGIHVISPRIFSKMKARKAPSRLSHPICVLQRRERGSRHSARMNTIGAIWGGRRTWHRRPRIYETGRTRVCDLDSNGERVTGRCLNHVSRLRMSPSAASSILFRLAFVLSRSRLVEARTVACREPLARIPCSYSARPDAVLGACPLVAQHAVFGEHTLQFATDKGGMGAAQINQPTIEHQDGARVVFECGNI